MGALIVRIGFWVPLYDKYKKDPARPSFSVQSCLLLHSQLKSSRVLDV